MITSSVSDCMVGSRVNVSPTGHESIARSAARVITLSYSRIRSPWKDGSINRRWRRCSSPSSSSTERGPSTGPSGAFASPARNCSCGPRKTCFTTSGSKTITNLGSNSVPIVTTSP